MQQSDLSHADLYRHLDPDEAAEFLGQSEATLTRRRHDRCGPKYVRLNSHVVKYRLIDLIAYQEKHLVTGENNAVA